MDWVRPDLPDLKVLVIGAELEPVIGAGVGVTSGSGFDFVV